MPDDRSKKIESVFLAALRVDPSQRAVLLDQLCPDDPELRTEVESLLAARDRVPEFLEKPAWTLVNAWEECPDSELVAEPDLPFERLGEYRLIRRIAEGGMGVVYLAVQESLGRRVALKVIKQEQRGTFEAERRFEREFQAVSELRHPNIVTVYGGGEEQGIRFFAMEYVSGTGLDAILRAAASSAARPPQRQLLTWIYEVARALECAHRAGIIHRDVKPSNIRITHEDDAMLMDFGVARHARHSTLTLTGQFRGTLHYSSPEQVKARSGDIDARTDVYSLGVTLYEALVGRLPFDGETTEQVLRQILDQDPPPPQRLNPRISRDLDTVITTAMEKDPARRYQSMAMFADDLERLLQGELVRAKPAGLGTKAWKKVARNPAASVAAGSTLLAVLSLVIYVLWSYPQLLEERAEAREQRQAALDEQAIAEREAETARFVNAFLEDMLSSPDPELDGRNVRVVEVLDRAALKVEQAFDRRPEIEAALRHVIGSTYLALGEYDTAYEHLSTACRMRRELLGDAHPDSLSSLNNLAAVLYRQGKYAEAEQLFRTILATGVVPEGETHLSTLSAMRNLASALNSQNKTAEAESLSRKVVELHGALLGNDHPETLAARFNMANLFFQQGKPAEAGALFRDLLGRYRSMFGPDHPRTLATIGALASVLMQRGELAEAAALLDEAVAGWSRTSGDLHQDTLACRYRLAVLLQLQGHDVEAETLQREVLACQRQALGNEHPDTLRSLNNLARLLQQRGMHAEAVDMFTELVDIQLEVLGEQHPSTLLSQNGLASALMAEGLLEEAESTQREVLETQVQALGEKHPNTLATRIGLAQMLMKLDRLADARLECQRAVAIAEEVLPTTSLHTALLHTIHGECLMRMREFPAAELELQKGHASLLSVLGASHQNTRASLMLLVELYEAWGRPEEEAECRARLERLRGQEPAPDRETNDGS